MNAITLYKSFKTFMCLGLIIVMFSFTNTLAWRGGGGGGHGGGGHGGGGHWGGGYHSNYWEDITDGMVIQPSLSKIPIIIITARPIPCILTATS